MRVLLVGAGGIAPEYVKALRAIGVDEIAVLSRTEASAKRLAESIELGEAHGGGAETLRRLADQYDGHILASSIESLLPLMTVLAEAEAPRVLVEKPVTLSSAELKQFAARYPRFNALTALNRLYFPSIAFMREKMAQEEVTSVDFSFCEWVHRIDPGAYSERELQHWGLSNCIHVIATVFDLIGLPTTLNAFVNGAGAVPWHSSGSVFTGAGVAASGVPFTYASDWRSAGRWSIAVRTVAGRYDLAPMEGVSFTPRGSVKSEVLLDPYAGDTKCGFVEMLQVWRDGEAAGPRVDLPALVPHLEAIEKIFGYGQ